MTHDELLEMISNKDQKAFSHIYNTYSRSLFAVVSNLIKDPDEAQDVLQNVFADVWKNIEDYPRSNQRLYTWILSIARSAAIERLRKGNGNRNNLDNFVHLLENSNRVANRIDVIGTRDFVKRLKPKCVQIIESLFFKGNSQGETSQQLEIPMAAVKTQNRNCILELRNYLEIN